MAAAMVGTAAAGPEPLVVVWAEGVDSGAGPEAVAGAEEVASKPGPERMVAAIEPAPLEILIM